MSEHDANHLSAALNRRGVAATRSSDGSRDRYAIQVSESAVALAWDALRTQRSAAGPPKAASTALLTTREAELRAEEQRLEARLGSAIEALPNVHSAAVLITLATIDNQLSELRRSPEAAAPRALISMVCDAGAACPSEVHLQRLLGAAVPGLSSSNIRILQQARADTEPPCAELGHVGPLTVTRASLPTLKLWFAASLVVHMLGSLALLLIVQRKRRPPPPRR